MSKGWIIALITFLSLLAISLVVFLVIFIKSDFKFDNLKNIGITFNNVSKTLVESKEITTIKDLDIKIDASDLEINDDDINTIKVELYSDSPKNYEITEENDKIKVVLEEKNKMNFFKKSPKVKIYVPKNYSKNITIDGNAADVDIYDLPYATLNTKLTVGDVKINEIKNATINVKTGDIKIEKVNTLTTNITTGDLRITNINDLVCKVTTGDVRINQINSSLDLTGKTGDVRIENANIIKNSKISLNVGDIRIKNVKGCYIDGKTRVGDTKINNTDRKSDIELNINADVGDIRVN